MKGFNLAPSGLAAKHTLTIRFSYLVVFKQISLLAYLLLDIMLFQTYVSSIAIILEGSYLYLIERLRAWKISLSVNRSGSCCAVVVLR